MAQTHSRPEVEARGLTRTYRVGASDVHALNDIDLDVAGGEFLGVVGVSGSGKSTLLHLIGGLDSPTSGAIRVADQQLAELTSYQRSIYRRRVVGFIFQSFYLASELSAEANIRLALTIQGTYGPTRRRLAGEALERVGLTSRASHRPGQLSVGEQQRVAVARAIVHRPRLLLADEPTANLDRATAIDLMNLLQDIQQQCGTTIIMVTHDDELAARYCHRLIRLRDGRLASQEEGVA
jgi:ABC-type lipoprotein export system ATPase subunit